MRRRDFITGLALAFSISTARSQQKRKVYHIAIAHPSASATDLTEESRGSIATRVNLKSLRGLGYIQGQNLLIERYSGEGRAPSYPELARDALRRNPDLIIALAGGLPLDFKAATTTIPILAIDASFVEKGIVPSLARPGGNITGVSVNIPIVEGNGTAGGPTRVGRNARNPGPI